MRLSPLASRYGGDLFFCVVFYGATIGIGQRQSMYYMAKEEPFVYVRAPQFENIIWDSIDYETEAQNDDIIVIFISAQSYTCIVRLEEHEHIIITHITFYDCKPSPVGTHRMPQTLNVI